MNMLTSFAVSALCLIAAAAVPYRTRRSLIGHFSTYARRRPTATLAAIGALFIALRLSCLPLLPRPAPRIPDEFSHILLGRTLALGRFANPPHPMWQHFETLFVMQQPTYASPYPPAQGMLLASGLILFNDLWVGVILSVAGMCMAIVWMLRAYLARPWALYGGALAVAGYGIHTYWINSYWGGAGAAIGGSLIFGALPRLASQSRRRDAVALGVGGLILANSRPYEGFLTSLAIAFALAVYFRGRGPNSSAIRHAQAVTLAMVVAAGLSLMCIYNWRVTGSPVKLPYVPYIQQYAAAPIFAWQTLPAPPRYGDRVMQEAHLSFRADYEAYSGIWSATRKSIERLFSIGGFYLGPFWVLVLPILPDAIRERRYRYVLAALVTCLVGILLTVGFQLHYVAPCASVFILLMVDSFRRLFRWSKVAGTIFLLAAPPAWLLGEVLRSDGRRPPSSLQQRPAIAAQIESTGGTHLVFVHYSPTHPLGQEWVYNEPDIDGSTIVWARDLGTERNRGLIRYYPARKVWIVEPDQPRVRIAECPSDCLASDAHGSARYGQ